MATNAADLLDKADDVLLDYEADEPDETEQHPLAEKRHSSEGKIPDISLPKVMLFNFS